MEAPTGIERARIDDNTGNFGINTTNPGEKLEVNGNIKGSGNLILSSLAGGGNRVIMVDQNGTLFPANQFSGGFWTTTGNTGTNDVSDFIGTTDFEDLVFKTKGAERMRITGRLDNDNHIGLVGIGTSAPEKEVHVFTTHTVSLGPPVVFDPCPNCEGPSDNGSGSTGTHNGIRLEDKTTVQQNMNIIHSVFDIEPMFNQLRLGPPQSPIMTLDGYNTNRRVGIGTTLPRARLDVEGDIVLGGTNARKFRFYTTSNQQNNNYIQLTYLSNNQWQFSEGITLRDNGNVGIGTTGPHSKLHVVGTTTLTGNVDIGVINLMPGTRLQVATTNGDVSFRSTTTNNPSGYNSLFVVDNNSTKAIAVQNSSSSEENFIIYGNGQTRIGKQTPISIHSDYQLAVDGKILGKKLFITQLNWADFVFSKNYKRKNYLEKEKELFERKRLNGMPSEQEIIENGLDVGTVMAGITQNVEENTLDIIDLSKKVDALTATIMKQQKLIEEQNKLIKKLQKRK